MSVAIEIIGELNRAGLMVQRGEGGRLRIDSPLGRPLDDELKGLVLAHRAELLAWLDWCETADALLLDCSRRLACCYPPGCPLEDAEWRAAEERLHAAFCSQDSEAWREALARYEHFALERFLAYESEVR